MIRLKPQQIDMAGAVAAPFSQAIGSVLLQILVARILGTAGLATFSVMYALIVVATAIATGYVGDSLTVLDRADPRVRAGLQRSLAVIVVVVGVVGALIVGAWGPGGAAQALVFGIATVAFVIEEILRRVLMASLRFWSIVVVDTMSMVGSLGLILLLHLLDARITLGWFLWAIVVGQVLASVAAVVVLPASERWWAPPLPGSWREVWGYGRWVALQKSVRPVMLVAVRVVAVAFVGRSVYGEIEAARVFVAPAILAVGGVGSYLFARSARDLHLTRDVALRRADFGAFWLVVMTIAVAGLCVLLLPVFGGIIENGRFEIDMGAALGWSAYSAAVAASTPYGMLAAVRARLSVTLLVRLGEAVVGIVGVAVTLAWGWSASTIPMVMAVAALGAAVGVRVQLVRGREILNGAPRRLSTTAMER